MRPSDAGGSHFCPRQGFATFLALYPACAFLPTSAPGSASHSAMANRAVSPQRLTGFPPCFTSRHRVLTCLPAGGCTRRRPKLSGCGRRHRGSPRGGSSFLSSRRNTSWLFFSLSFWRLDVRRLSCLDVPGRRLGWSRPGHGLHCPTPS